MHYFFPLIFILPQLPSQLGLNLKKKKSITIETSVKLETEEAS